MPAVTGVTHERTTTPSTTTRHSWQTPIPQYSPRGVPDGESRSAARPALQQRGGQALTRRRLAAECRRR